MQVRDQISKIRQKERSTGRSSRQLEENPPLNQTFSTLGWAKLHALIVNVTWEGAESWPQANRGIRPKLFKFQELSFIISDALGVGSARGRVVSGTKREFRVRRGDRNGPIWAGEIMEGQKLRDEGRDHLADPPPVFPRRWEGPDRGGSGV